jgi:hypothetical protein
MDLLTFAASGYFLGFCCAVTYFEGSGYTDQDPAARLLRQSSRPGAAQGIERHFLINKTQNHSRVGEELAGTLTPVCADTVISAVRINELLSVSGQKLAIDLYKKVELLL